MKDKKLDILLVEDDLQIQAYTKACLDKLGHHVAGSASSGEAAVMLAKNLKIDLVLMDISLEKTMDGTEAGRLIHRMHKIPIVYLTALDDEETLLKVRASNPYGYINKPFNTNKLRIALALAMDRYLTENPAPNAISLGKGYDYYPSTYKLTLQGTAITLTGKESRLLHILALNHGRLVDYPTIETWVWDNQSVSDIAIRELVSRLRKKIHLLTCQNISGNGYMLK